MKMMTLAAVVTALLLPLSDAAQAARDPAGPARNSVNAGARTSHLVSTPRGTGLAPTTWGFASKYSGTLYGSGYYAFRIDLTYAGVNSDYGYTFNYPSAGFTNDIRALYLFDVSGLAGQPGPLWSAFMFDVRQAPPAGGEGLIVLGDVSLNQAGANYSLQGLSLQQVVGGATRNVDVYDAEDLENANPFNTPELAFTGTNNVLIGSFSAASGAVTPFNIDVTNAVNLDAPPAQLPVAAPALSTTGIATFALLLMASGLMVMRRRS
jgi:hypothetical protein